MKISASIYSNKGVSITETAKEIDKYNIDCLHIDCNNDLSVFDDIIEIKKNTTKPIDLHLITSEPELFYDKIKECQISQVTFQFET